MGGVDGGMMQTCWEKRVYDDYTMQTLPTDRRKEGRQRWFYVREFIPQDRNAAILDVGAGLGEFERTLRARGYTNVTSIDTSEWQLAMAGALGNNVTNADGIEFMTHHRAQFDCILILNVLEHLDPPTLLMILDAAQRALKPGGVLIAQVPNAIGPLAAFWVTCLTHKTQFSPWRMEQLRQLCGFASVECRECGIEPVGFWSLIRRVLWIPIRLVWTFLCLVMTGATLGGVYTPNMIAAMKKGK